jgi:hypothetical protein
MSFSAENLEKLHAEAATIGPRFLALQEAILTHTYRTVRAKEFAQHGFARRVKTIARAIRRFNEILPPERADLPSSDELTDAVAYVQAHVFNVFGAMDNLAWIWVQEKRLTKANGQPLPDSYVGLRVGNALVRQSFSQDFHSYLRTLDAWFEMQEDFRHALAHRIPLYIPPYIVPTEQAEKYNQLEEAMAAAFGVLDPEQYEALKAEQKALVVFRPWMTHSFSEEAKHVVIHFQVLQDFLTVEETAFRLLAELNGLPAG